MSGLEGAINERRPQAMIQAITTPPVIINPVDRVRRTIAESADGGKMTLSQIAQELNLSAPNVASILEHNSRHFYGEKIGGVVHWSLAY